MEDQSGRVTPLPITTSDGGKVGCYGRGRCCTNNPGWFGPGEMEKAAAHLGLEPEELFRKCLVVVTAHVVDVPGKPAVDLFAPAKVDERGAPLMPTGARVPQVYEIMRGACIFYRQGRCDIHAARPIECRRYFCEQPDEENLSRAALARMWWDAAQAEREGG
jgi:Fe-S-cluster containining protein